jgi:hypothetical protein
MHRSVARNEARNARVLLERAGREEGRPEPWLRASRAGRGAALARADDVIAALNRANEPPVVLIIIDTVRARRDPLRSVDGA